MFTNLVSCDPAELEVVMAVESDAHGACERPEQVLRGLGRFPRERAEELGQGAQRPRSASGVQVATPS